MYHNSPNRQEISLHDALNINEARLREAPALTGAKYKEISHRESVRKYTYERPPKRGGLSLSEICEASNARFDDEAFVDASYGRESIQLKSSKDGKPDGLYLKGGKNPNGGYPWLNFTIIKQGRGIYCTGIPCYETDKSGQPETQEEQERRAKQAKADKVNRQIAKQKYKEQKLARQKEVAKQSADVFRNGSIIEGDSAYAQDKQIHFGPYYTGVNDRRFLVTVMEDIEGNHWNNEWARPKHHEGDNHSKITSPDGTYKSGSGGRRKGLIFRINTTQSLAELADDESVKKVAIGEGRATLDAVCYGKKWAGIACFDAGNLVHVVHEIKKHFPKLYAKLVVFADNDASRTGEDVAQRTGLPYVLPPIAGQDWKDIEVEDGEDALREALNDKRNKYPTGHGCTNAVDIYESAKSWLARHQKEAAFEEDDEPLVKRCLEHHLYLKRFPNEKLIKNLLFCVKTWREKAHDEAKAHFTFTNPDYRFNSLEEMVKNLPIADLASGNFLINAGHGEGKTKIVIGALVDYARDKMLEITVEAPTQALAKKISHQFSLVDYEKAKIDGCVKNGRLATCSQSNHHPKLVPHLNAMDLFVFDEIDQCIDQALSDDMENKNSKTANNWDALKEIFSRKQGIIGLSAGSSDRDADIIGACGGSQPITIQIDRKPNGKVMRFVNSTTPLLNTLKMIMKDIIAGKKVAIACAVRKDAEALSKQLKQIGVKVLEATRYTKSDPSFKQLLKDPDIAVNSHNVFIYSPVVKSGVSQETDYFDKGYFLNTGDCLTSGDSVQMVGRCRAVKEWTYVTSQNGQAVAVSAEQLSKKNQAKAYYGDIASGYRTAVDANDQWKSIEIADFDRYFLWELSFNGWSIKRADGVETSQKERAQVNATRREIGAYELATIANAKPFFDEIERRDLQFKRDRTFEEEARLVKDNVCEWLGSQDVTEADVWLFYNKQGKWCVDNVRALYGLITEQERRDNADVVIREKVIKETGIGKAFKDGYFTKDEAKKRNQYRCRDDVRSTLWAFGLMPAKYGRFYRYNKKEAKECGVEAGSLKPMPLPNHPMREIHHELEAFGVFGSVYKWGKNIFRRTGKHGSKHDHEIIDTSWQNHLLELAKSRYQVLLNEEPKRGQNGVFSNKNIWFCPLSEVPDPANNDTETDPPSFPISQEQDNSVGGNDEGQPPKTDGTVSAWFGHFKSLMQTYYDEDGIYQDDIAYYPKDDVPMDPDDDCVAGGVITKDNSYEVRTNVHTERGIFHKKMDFLKTQHARDQLFGGRDDFKVGGAASNGSREVNFVGEGIDSEIAEKLLGKLYKQSG